MNEADVRALGSAIRGQLLREGDDDYDMTRRIWNGMIDKKPALIVRCSGVADVVKAVEFGRRHALDIAIRGGGHNVAGNAVCDDGLMIDMSLMNGVKIDLQARTAWVQGGAKLGDMDRETQLHGLACPAGVVSHTGVAGLTLGGGTGWLSGKYGLTIDNLLAVELVTADGRILRASETEHADLFWALKGGGGNFGVATAFEFALHEVGPEVMRTAVMYPQADAASVISKWRELLPTLGDDITSLVLLWCIPAMEAFPQALWGKPVVVIMAVYAGDAAEGASKMQLLRELATPVLDLSGPLPYTELQQTFDAFMPLHEYLYYWKSLKLDTISDEVIAEYVGNAESRPTKSLIIIQAMRGAYSRVDADATAYGDRSTPFLLEINATWVDAADSDKNMQWTRAFWGKMKNFSSSGAVYLNHPGFGEEGEEMVKAAYGANYDRLVQIKNSYDPDNLFHMNQNIVPTV